MELTVDAPLADIENHGLFQSVTIQSVKPDTWTEYAVGNTLRVLAQASRIVVEKGARLKSLEYAIADAKAKLDVNGTVDQVIVSEKTEPGKKVRKKTKSRFFISPPGKKWQILS